jgi:RNA polymerase sigma-70 factor (ECF subfamily)
MDLPATTEPSRLADDPPATVNAEADSPRQAVLAEAALVGRAQEGDVASFEVLVRRYQGPVFRLGQRMLADRGDAEDMVQDTFVMVWRRLPTLVDAESFRSWVYQIATRRCLNVLRARDRRPSTPTETDDLEAAQAVTHRSAVDDPAAAAERSAQLSGLDAVLQTLPAEQRACWVLREMHELTYPEIAYATHLPVSTVRGRIARARQNLVKGMDQWR